MTLRYLGLFFFSISIAAPVTAQVPLGSTGAVGAFERAYSIRGSVRLIPDGAPIANVRVVLATFPERTLASTLTPGNGFFEFANLPVGEYEIIIEDLGYGSFRQQVNLRAGSVEDLQIYLRSATLAPRGPASSTVSVEELSRPRKALKAMREGLDLLYGKSDYRGSLASFERAIREDPGYYQAYAQSGAAQMFLKEYAGSEAALRKSLELSNGKYAEANLLLATLYSDTGRYADAEPFARQAARIDPERWAAHSELARALLGLDRPEEAETSAVTAVQLHPESALLRLLLADIHIALHKYPALLDDLEHYLELAPDGSMADQARKMREQLELALAGGSAAASSAPAPVHAKK